MSIKSARAFRQRIVTDQALQAQLLNAISDDQRREIILTAGYRFTPSEWEAALAEILSDDNQLSDAELVAIAGGVGAIAEGQALFYQPPSRVWASLGQSISTIKSWLQLFSPSAWSIKTKLSVALLSVALIPMSFTAYYNLQQSLDKAVADEYRKLELSAASNASRLDQLIMDIQRVVVQVSTERDVVSFLTAATPEQQSAFQSSLQRTLENIFRSNPDYDAVYLMDKGGHCLAATDPTFMGQNYAFREYFRQAIRGRSYVSSILVETTSGRPGIYFSNPVRSNSGQIMGVAVLKIKGEDIWAIVNALQAGSESYAFLVDQQGVIISHPDQSFLYHSLAPLSPKRLQQIVKDRLYGLEQIESLNLPELAAAIVGAKEPGHTSYDSPLGQSRQMVGFAPLEEEPWVLAVNKPNPQFTAPLHHLIWQNSQNVLVAGAIAAISALILARSIARPIRDLTKAAQALVQDDFNPQTLTEASRSQDDVGQLVRVFLQMAEEVRAREQKLKQQVRELNIEIDEVRKAREVAEITETDYFQQLQKKGRKLKGRAVEASEIETDYFRQLHKKAQQLKGRAVEVGK